VSAARNLVRRLRGSVLDRFFERSGETSEAVRLGDLGLARDGYHDYEPSGWRSFKRAMRGVKVDPSDTFLDIGCGKGRVVEQAARRPFKRVLGVELSTELAEQARRLAERERDRRRCDSVEIFAADITTWQIPDDVTVIYVYNALSGDALVAMLDRIAESARRAPRRLLMLYVNPLSERTVIDHPQFELRGRRGRRRWAATDPRRVSVFEVRSERSQDD
jgi:SAM-dependent methyltransferase